MERMMIGVHLLGEVGGLLSRMTGEVSSERTSVSSCSLMKRLIGIGHCGMGARILGDCCSSGMSFVEFVVMVGAAFGTSILHSGL